MLDGLHQAISESFRILNHFLFKYFGSSMKQFKLVPKYKVGVGKGYFCYSVNTAHDVLSPRDRFLKKIVAVSLVFLSRLMGLTEDIHAIMISRLNPGL